MAMGFTVDLVQRKANRPKSLYSCKKQKTKQNKTKKNKKKKKRPRIVKATFRSIYSGLFNYLDESIRRFVFVCKQGMNSTGFSTKKQYAILLEFLSDLCPAGFCLSMIPFISAINRKCCAGINKFLEYSGRERQSDTSTAFKLLS